MVGIPACNGNQDAGQPLSCPKGLKITGLVVGLLGVGGAAAAYHFGKISRQVALVAGGAAGLTALVSSLALRTEQASTAGGPKKTLTATKQQTSVQIIALLEADPKLEEIDLSEFRGSGTQLQELAIAIGKHPGLKVANFGEVMPWAPVSWFGFVHLPDEGEKFLARTTRINPSWVESMRSEQAAEILARIPQLRHLDASLVHFDDQAAIASFFEAVEKTCPHLEGVYLPQWDLDPEALTPVQERYLQKASSLSLAGTEDADTARTLIEKMPNLTSLHLTGMPTKLDFQQVVTDLLAKKADLQLTLGGDYKVEQRCYDLRNDQDEPEFKIAQRALGKWTFVSADFVDFNTIEALLDGAPHCKTIEPTRDASQHMARIWEFAKTRPHLTIRTDDVTGIIRKGDTETPQYKLALRALTSFELQAGDESNHALLDALKSAPNLRTLRVVALGESSPTALLDFAIEQKGRVGHLGLKSTVSSAQLRQYVETYNPEALWFDDDQHEIAALRDDADLFELINERYELTYDRHVEAEPVPLLSSHNTKVLTTGYVASDRQDYFFELRRKPTA